MRSPLYCLVTNSDFSFVILAQHTRSIFNFDTLWQSWTLSESIDYPSLVLKENTLYKVSVYLHTDLVYVKYEQTPLDFCSSLLCFAGALACTVICDFAPVEEWACTHSSSGTLVYDDDLAHIDCGFSNPHTHCASGILTEGINEDQQNRWGSDATCTQGRNHK